MITTNLLELQAALPCDEGVERITKFWNKKLGKYEADDEPFPMSQIIEAFGGPRRVYHASWCFRVLPTDHMFRIGLFTAACVERWIPVYATEFADDGLANIVSAIRYYSLGYMDWETLQTFQQHAYASTMQASTPEVATALRDAHTACQWASAAPMGIWDEVWDAGPLGLPVDQQEEVFKEYFDTPLSHEDYVGQYIQRS